MRNVMHDSVVMVGRHTCNLLEMWCIVKDSLVSLMVSNRLLLLNSLSIGMILVEAVVAVAMVFAVSHHRVASEIVRVIMLTVLGDIMAPVSVL